MRTRPDTDRSQCVKQTNVIAITSINNGKVFGGTYKGSANSCLRLKAGFRVNGKAFKGQVKVVLIRYLSEAEGRVPRERKSI